MRYETSAKLVLCVEKIKRLGDTVYAEGTVERHLLIGDVEHISFMLVDGNVSLVKKHITSLKQGFKQERFFTATRTYYDAPVAEFVKKEIKKMSVKVVKPSQENKYRTANKDTVVSKVLGITAPKSVEWKKDSRWGNQEATEHRKGEKTKPVAKTAPPQKSFAELFSEAKQSLRDLEKLPPIVPAKKARTRRTRRAA